MSVEMPRVEDYLGDAIPGGNDDDFCHMIGNHEGRTLCGAAENCWHEQPPAPGGRCRGCGRPMCPECLDVAAM